MFFDKVKSESSIMKQIQCKPLGLPNHTPWQTEDQGTTNKLGQDPHHGHITCMRYFQGGTTFQTPLVCGFIFCEKAVIRSNKFK